MECLQAVVKVGGRPQFLFEVLYSFCMVRGSKTLLKFVPHEVADLEPLFSYLVSTDLTDTANWQAHYFLLVWLSVVVLVPFDIETIDSYGALVDRMLNVAKGFLKHTGRPREAASSVIAKLLTRPDVQRAGFLEAFLSAEVRGAEGSEIFNKLGVLSTVVQLFKVGNRGEMLPHISQVTSLLELKDTNTNLNVLKVKLASALAMTQLKPVVTSWRYQRGSRSLTANLQTAGAEAEIITNASVTSVRTGRTGEDQGWEGVEEDTDLELLERLIDALLEGLRDRDTLVRWSAAKGIGRVTGRLSFEMASELLGPILELFAPTESDSAWHGGCLALAELARRGLLLPDRLAEVFPVIYKSLLYEKQKGTYTIGSNVRDAACYVAWSFARAYSPDQLAEFVEELARHLLIVMLYDREVNCRRAASAAFQEHVGRQGSFPHGIEILTEADYFTLGNRNHAYLQVSCFVAQYPEYQQPLITHLLEVKLKHSDPVIRQLAACGISVLVPFCPDFIINEVILKLITRSLDSQQATRHGAILGLGEVLIGLAGKSALNNDPQVIERMLYKHSTNYYLLTSKDTASEQDKALLKDSDNRTAFRELYTNLQAQSHLSLLSDALQMQIRKVIADIEKKRLYRGKGGQIIRCAVCRFVECIALAGLVLPAKDIVLFQGTLNESLLHINDEVKAAAAAALIQFSKVYHNSAGAALVDKTVKLYITSLADFNLDREIPANITRGAGLGLGCLSYAALSPFPEEVINVLIDATRIRGNDKDDADTRRNVTASLGDVVAVFAKSELGMNPGDVVFKESYEMKTPHSEFHLTVLDCLYCSMEDYSTDKRGDIGSWIRTAAMQDFVKIVELGLPLRETDWDRMIGHCLMQLAEKIDRVRQVAGDILTQLLKTRAHSLPDWSAEIAPVFLDNSSYIQQYYQELEKQQKAEALPDQTEMPVQSATTTYERVSLWSVPLFVFPLITPLLSLTRLRRYIIRGLVVSTGGITESTMRSAAESLVSYIKHADPSVVWSFAEVYSEREERLSVPFMKTLELLLRDAKQELLAYPSLGSRLFATTQEILRGSKDIMKWQAGVCVYTGLLDFPEVARESLRVLMVLLCHIFPKVRAAAAANLFNFLQCVVEPETLGVSQDTLDAVIDLVASTSWVQKVVEVKGIRNHILTQFNFELPEPAGAKKEATGKRQAEDESYKSLVREVGY
jgi:hypothetical protein